MEKSKKKKFRVTVTINRLLELIRENKKIVILNRIKVNWANFIKDIHIGPAEMRAAQAYNRPTFIQTFRDIYSKNNIDANNDINDTEKNNSSGY